MDGRTTGSPIARRPAAIPRPAILLLALASLAFPLAAAPAEPAPGRDASYEAAYREAYELAAARFRPSPLALRMALAACGEGLYQLPPAEAAALAHALAIKAERVMRFGGSAQEARATLAQELALSAGGRPAPHRFMRETGSPGPREGRGYERASATPPGGSGAPGRGGGKP
ncbi:MAG TPA: hypothetical protein PLB91_07140 [Spirochaetales bacterium]|nr:hypothetical protein [Spirochaetales bacterium]HRY53365.1 hypothetical protein [Spirochaetia bacterium]HRZ65243.1 hypothetical protein [Spirochaetia bacterium]